MTTHFTAAFIKLLYLMRNSAQGRALPHYRKEIDVPCAQAGYDAASIFASDGSLKGTTETRSLRMLMRLFQSVGLEPRRGNHPARHASSALVALANLIANFALSQVIRLHFEFIEYVNWKTVLLVLEQYCDNLANHGYCLMDIE